MTVPEMVASEGWNLDTLIELLQLRGGDFGIDNDGQVIIYTGLCENIDGSLVVMEDHEIQVP